MKALLGDVVVADSPQEDLVKIEGNWYFPPASVKGELLEKSDTPYHCPWKGDCQYFNVRSDAGVINDLAWSYPNPILASFERVGHDYTDYVAFGKDIKFVD